MRTTYFDEDDILLIRLSDKPIVREVSQSAYAQQEAKEPVRKATREKIAEALGIAAEQLAV